jgi:hypothetical protein
MNPSSVTQTGTVEVEDVVSGWKLVSELLRPLGLAICEHIDADVAGFTYIVYQPRAHRAGRGKYLYAGASMRHPLSHRGLADFGPADDEARCLETTAGAVRFVIATTAEDVAMLNAERLLLLKGLNAAEDPRFWNPQEESASSWEFAPAGASSQAERLTG